MYEKKIDLMEFKKLFCIATRKKLVGVQLS